MAWVILLAIIAVPLVEVALFIEVGQRIGFLATIAAAVMAGIAGLALWRLQGLTTMLRARQALERGEMPVREVFDGVCLLIAGGLLLLPGFLSDVVALPLLLPPVRRALGAWLGTRAVVMTPPPPDGTHDRPLVIDVDYEEVPPSDRNDPDNRQR